MATMEAPHSFDWAHDAYAALHDKTSIDSMNSVNSLHDMASPRQQPANNWPLESTANHTCSIPPSLLTHATIERYGQVTPPEQLSPAEPLHREGSIPVDQLRNEPLWPEHQTAAQHMHASPSTLSPKRRRAGRQASAHKLQAEPAPQRDTSPVNPQPPKRKRGRPKAQSQLVEPFSTDGFSFQASSARQSHLEKNRVAAHKCRQRKKEYINGLEERARDFSSKNKILKENVTMLREEALSLKNEVLRHAGCGFWAVDKYLARCAGDLLGMEAPQTLPSNSCQNSSHGLGMTSDQLQAHHGQTDDTMSFGSHDSDSFRGLELLRDFDNDDMDELEKMI